MDKGSPNNGTNDNTSDKDISSNNSNGTDSNSGANSTNPTTNNTNPISNSTLPTSNNTNPTSNSTNSTSDSPNSTSINSENGTYIIVGIGSDVLLISILILLIYWFHNYFYYIAILSKILLCNPNMSKEEFVDTAKIIIPKKIKKQQLKYFLLE